MNINDIKLYWINKPKLRFYLFVFFLLPVPIAIFITSLFFRMPKSDLDKTTMSNYLRKRDEITKMKLLWSDSKEKSIRSDWENAKENIPTNYEDVLFWMEDFQKFVSSRGFDMSYTLEEVIPHATNQSGFARLPIKMSLKVREKYVENQEFFRSWLQIFIDTIKTVLDKNDNLDLGDITARGEGYSISEIDLDFVMWVGFKGDVFAQ